MGLISAGIPLASRGLPVPRALPHGLSDSHLPIRAQNPQWSLRSKICTDTRSAIREIELIRTAPDAMIWVVICSALEEASKPREECP